MIPGIVTSGLELWSGEECAKSYFRQRMFSPSTHMPVYAVFCMFFMFCLRWFEWFACVHHVLAAERVTNCALLAGVWNLVHAQRLPPSRFAALSVPALHRTPPLAVPPPPLVLHWL